MTHRIQVRMIVAICIIFAMITCTASAYSNETKLGVNKRTQIEHESNLAYQNILNSFLSPTGNYIYITRIMLEHTLMKKASLLC